MTHLSSMSMAGVVALGVLFGASQLAHAEPRWSPDPRAAASELSRLSTLANQRYAEGHLPEAIAVAEQAVAMARRVLPPRHPAIAACLHNLAQLYRVQGAYAKAEPLYLRALEIRDQVLGPTHPEVATSLDGLAELYRAQEGCTKAVPLFQRTLEIRQATLGALHPLVATTLNSLATCYQAQGALGAAEPLYTRALQIREQALGPTHPDVAMVLNNLGSLYHAQGADAKAEPLLVRALDIRQRSPGADPLGMACSLNNLAEHYRTQGAYAKAEPLLLRALEIYEKQPRETVDQSSSLNNLALLYKAQRAYARAEPLFVRALAIRERFLGATHPDVADTLKNLSDIYVGQHAYARALPLSVRALEIRERALGPIHPEVATRLIRVAALHVAERAYSMALPLALRALQIREQTLGARHLDVAGSLDVVATIKRRQGDLATAEPLYLRALDIRDHTPTGVDYDTTSLVGLLETYAAQGADAMADAVLLRVRQAREHAVGPLHPSIASILAVHAESLQDRGAFAQAEPLRVQALAIHERALGPMHIKVADSLDALAWLYLAGGALTKIEPLYLRALDIRKRALGASHPDVARSLDRLAELYKIDGRSQLIEPLRMQALAIMERALGATDPEVASSLDSLGELYNEQGAHAKAEPLLVRALAIYEKTPGAASGLASVLDHLASVYQAQSAHTKAQALLARAAELHEATLPRALSDRREQENRATMLALKNETERVVSLQAHHLPASASALELALTTVLRRKGRALDSLTDQRRARREGTMAATDRRPAPITIASIQAALPRGAALVEFVRYHRVDPKLPAPWQEEHYLAYVLPSQGSPEFVPLGEAAPIDREIGTLFIEMHTSLEPTAGAPGGVAPELKALIHAMRMSHLKRLDDLLLAPVRAHLRNITHLILSPDSALNAVPFEALVDGEGHYEIEQRLVSYVTSGRDLLRFRDPRSPRSPATIIAAPDYGVPGATVLPARPSFRRLEGALSEVTTLTAHFASVRTITGKDATKAALADLVGPTVLHIATHGYYAADASSRFDLPYQLRVVSRSAPRVQETGLAAERGMELDEPSARWRRADDPIDALDRSGLALAGANVGPAGIATAREIAGYDWSGTKMVVLSACDTGVGAVPTGEGVYGLRRAVVAAGAESQVISLWNVSDQATSELMRAFYGELARGTGRAEALRLAKLKLSRQSRFAHPYYWASFVFAGDWTALDPTLFTKAAHAR